MADRTPAPHPVLTSHGERRLSATHEESTSPEVSTSPADLVGDLEVIGAPRRVRGGSGAFPDVRARRRYLIVLLSLVVLAAAFGLGLLAVGNPMPVGSRRSEEHTSELQSRLVISYAVFCLKKKKFLFQILLAYNAAYLFDQNQPK